MFSSDRVPLERNAVHLNSFSRDAFFVAAAEGCVRLRSSRESGCRDVPDAPQWLILRPLRSRTQASPAATDRITA
ncbi:hypothetical protein EMIT0194MI4_60293 [Pseudomonas sp. IT-194MI4]